MLISLVFVASKVWKIPKIDKNVKMEEVKIHIYWETDEFQWNFQEKEVLMILKVTKNTKLDTFFK